MKKNLRELKPEFIRLYKEENKSIREIARIYGVDKSSVSRYIHEGTKIRIRGLSDEQKEKAEILYEKGLSLRAIAINLNASINTVRTHLIKKYGELRTASRKNRKYEHLVEDFVRDYKNGMSSWEIAKKYNATPSTVLNYIEEKHVEVRDYSESSIRYEINDNYFDILSERNSYVLGVILGLSSENRKASIDFIDLRFSKNQEHLMNLVLNDIYISEKPYKNNINSTTVIRVQSKPLVKRFIELKKQIINGHMPKELDVYREYFLKGLIDSSKIDIEKGICLKIFKSLSNLIKTLISDYYNITKVNEDLNSVFTSSENLRILRLTFCTEYEIYKIDKLIKPLYLEENLNLKECSYIIYFYKDQEFNIVKK